MKYEAVIFDWDGTLVDSTGRIVEAMQLASADAGMTKLSDFDIKQIIGLGLPEAICELWPKLEQDVSTLNEMRRLYNLHYMSDLRSVMTFYDHAENLLTGLLRANLDIAVATGKSRQGLDRAFREFKIGHMFRDSRCADETKSKPHPLMLEELSSSLGVDPSAMVMIGDTEFDLKMANAAGIDGVAITHGAHDEKKLKACNPVMVVDSLKELHNWLLN